MRDTACERHSEIDSVPKAMPDCAVEEDLRMPCCQHQKLQLASNAKNKSLKTSRVWVDLRLPIVLDAAALSHEPAGGKLPGEDLEENGLARPWRTQQECDASLHTLQTTVRRLGILWNLQQGESEAVTATRSECLQAAGLEPMLASARRRVLHSS